MSSVATSGCICQGCTAEPVHKVEREGYSLEMCDPHFNEVYMALLRLSQARAKKRGK